MQQTRFLLIRQRYDLFIWKWENLFLSYVNNKGADQPTVWSAPLLFAAWIVTRFYSSKLYGSISTYTVSPTCQFAESVFRYLYICLSLSFTPQERCYTDSVSLCRFFVINRFDKKKRFCDFRDTDFWIVSGQWNQSLYGYIQKGYFVLDMCNNSVWKLPFVDNMKEDCVLLEKLRKLYKGRPRVVCAMCPRIWKRRKSTEAWTVHNTALNSSMGIDIT